MDSNLQEVVETPKYKVNEIIPPEKFPSWNGAYGLYKKFFNNCMDGGFTTVEELEDDANRLFSFMYSNCGSNPEVDLIINQQLKPLSGLVYDQIAERDNPADQSYVEAEQIEG